jgi:hypothetical protein
MIASLQVPNLTDRSPCMGAHPCRRDEAGGLPHANITVAFLF